MQRYEIFIYTKLFMQLFTGFMRVKLQLFATFFRINLQLFAGFLRVKLQLFARLVLAAKTTKNLRTFDWTIFCSLCAANMCFPDCKIR